MPTLHAGHVICRSCHGRGDIEEREQIRNCRNCDGRGWLHDWHLIEVTAGQMTTLGFAAKQKPHKLKIGCGTDACAYDLGDSVVKVTKDPRDAIAAAAILRTTPQPLWAIPIRAVYLLRPGSDIYILVLARAQVPLPPEWYDPIAMVFDDADDEKKWGDGGLKAEEWHGPLGYEGWVRNIELANITKGGESEARKKLRRAVETINEMMVAMRGFGLDGSDFHPGNWGMYQGRAVLIDFGMARLRKKSTGSTKLPEPKDIPVLPFTG